MDIALAIIVDPDHTMTLIAQRPAGVHLALLWEFPGGKIEDGETAMECAIREAFEETGLTVLVVETWNAITFAYLERTVTLHPFLCEADPANACYNRWLWVPIDQLGNYAFPEANVELLELLRRIRPSGIRHD
jgi:8-oxo-dGTP diphosphatase